MLSNHLSQFLRDERGSYTMWSLVWFLIYLGIGGLAVDMTDGYRNQTLLQSTADAAALAGVISLPDEGEAVTQALNYAANNMAENDYNGTVLTAQDVVIGTWDFDTETFESHTTDPNAVFVTTRRARQNDNPVIMNFLRIMALWGLDPRMDVIAEAVAAHGVHKCHNDGIIAGGDFTVTTHTHFVNNICLIGQESFAFNQNGTSFEVPGVYVGVGCLTPTDCLEKGNNPYMDEEFAEAFNLDNGGNYDPTGPDNANNVPVYIEAVLDLANQGLNDPTPYADFDAFEFDYETEYPGVEFSGLDYLAIGGTVPPVHLSVSEPPEVPLAHTVYEVDCASAGGITLPEGTYTNVAIIANCKIDFPSHAEYKMTDTLIATTATGKHAMHAPADVNFGADDCDEGGVELYAYGEIFFAAAGGIANTRVLGMTDVQFSAQASGPVGVNIEAGGDFQTASGSNSQGGGAGNTDPDDIGTMGLCDNDNLNGPVALTYALVR